MSECGKERPIFLVIFGRARNLERIPIFDKIIIRIRLTLIIILIAEK